MATAKQVLDIARAEIGYTESKNNDNKYGREYGLNNQPWCVIFIWWIFKHANASNIFYGSGKIALCSALYNFHKVQNEAVNPIPGNLYPGDVVFFDFSGRKTDTSHVGIIESINGSTLTTIEGNTSSGNSGSQSNGDGVYRRTRYLSQVSKAFHPKYDKDESPATPVSAPKASSGNENLKSLQKVLNLRGAKLAVDGIWGPLTAAACMKYSVSYGSKNKCVGWVQGRLKALGYDITVDDAFGKITRAAIYDFQNKKFGPSGRDGVVGPNTYKALL